MPVFCRAALVLFILSALPALADTRLPGWFTDHMVLQRDKPVPIWGWDSPGAEVTVSFAGQTKTATADAAGKWSVRLDPMPANASGATLAAAGSSTVTLQDVLVGEVWLCSGQSNMGWTVGNSFPKGGPANHPVATAIAAADLPAVRMVSIARVTVPAGPAADVKGNWVVATPDSVRGFSAVGFFFGQQLHAELQVPIGLIHSSWGGTPVEAWTSRDALAATPLLAPMLTQWAESTRKYNPEQAQKQYDAAKAAWETQRDAAKEAGKPIPRAPQMNLGPLASPHHPATLYNGMIAPLLPYAIRGAIWYQGEANGSRAWAYRTAFPLLITDWRTRFGQGDFPFGFVVLANYQKPMAEPGNSNWAELRESQHLATQLPAVGYSSAIDIGQETDIHPKNKLDVGLRMAGWAMATVYGDTDREWSGPVYRDMTVKDGAIVLSFDHVGSGLTAGTKRDFAPFVPVPDAPLKHFQIAGADKTWVWADARIDGDTVIVSSPRVAEPVAVRYAWANNPATANLYNREGLPAVSFRTDDWRLSTQPAPPEGN